MKNKIKQALVYLIISVFIWISISTTIQRFKNPNMSETELFLNIPKSFICKWE